MSRSAHRPEPGVAQPSPEGPAELPRDDPLHPAMVARRRRRAEELARAKGVLPLTMERLRELGTGGPWESDAEFDSWLAEIYETRRRDIA